jgi:hypothetical protein
MGRAELLEAPAPVTIVTAGQLGQGTAPGLVPHLGRGAIRCQLDSSLFPVVVVLVGIAGR